MSIKRRFHSLSHSRIASIILLVTYGYTVKAEDDPMVTIPLESMDNFSASTLPGAWLVNVIPQRAFQHYPILPSVTYLGPGTVQYLPRWMPGARFLRIAKGWRETTHKGGWGPYLWCKENLVRFYLPISNVPLTSDSGQWDFEYAQLLRYDTSAGGKLIC